MKKAVSLALTLSLLLLLAACSGSSKNSAMPASNDVAYTADNGGWFEEAPEPAGNAPADYDAVQSGTGSIPVNTKIIYTADINLETKEFDSASQALDQLVEALGGYYESHSLNQGGSYRSLSCTIRIPAERFSEFLSRAGEAAHVTSKNEYKDDISEAYYDSEARLATQQTKLERLLALLEQASTMEDIISLENAISETELQIEYLTGSLRKYDSLVSYSTITLYLKEVYRLSSDDEPAVTFGQRLSAALSSGLERGIEALEDLTIGIARNWMTLLLLAAVVTVILVLLLRRRRRKASPPASSAASKEDTTPKT